MATCAKWIPPFQKIVELFKECGTISSSLVYRLAGLHDAVAPLWGHNPDIHAQKSIHKLFLYEYSHSLPAGLKKTDEQKQYNREVAGHLAGVCLSFHSDNFDTSFTPEVPVIARFLGMAGRSRQGGAS